MEIGAVFPAAELGSDPAIIRDWAQAADELGYEHIMVFEHLIGFRESPDPSYVGPITPDILLHEPMTFLAFLAAITRRVRLVTGVILLPLRQTVLLAKQAAEVDALSGGRLRLGIGVGQNKREYEVMNESWYTRGRRMDEQVHVLRALWSDDAVDFRGRYHQIPDGAGLLRPRATQRSIPIWMGGRTKPAMARAAHLGDGWMPVLLQPDENSRALISEYRALLDESGRANQKTALNIFTPLRFVGQELWAEHARRWEQLGATHLTVELESAGLNTVRDHLHALERWKVSVTE